MRNKRRIVWAASMRNLREGEAPDGVREERLRATSGLLRGLDLTSWRGRSGRRYVVGVHPLTEGELFDVTEAVILAVRRAADGVARLVEAAAAGPELRPQARRLWIARAKAKGGNELHIHRLAAGASERAAIVADLRDETEQPALTEPLRDAPGPGR
jgi:hypothetical protein